MVRPIDLQTIFMQESYAAEKAAKKKKKAREAQRRRQRYARYGHRYVVKETTETDRKSSLDRDRGNHIDAYA